MMSDNDELLRDISLDNVAIESPSATNYIVAGPSSSNSRASPAIDLNITRPVQRVYQRRVFNDAFAGPVQQDQRITTGPVAVDPVAVDPVATAPIAAGPIAAAPIAANPIDADPQQGNIN